MVNQFIKMAEQVETIVKIVNSDATSINKTLSQIVNNEPVVVSKFNFVDTALLSEFEEQNNNLNFHPSDEELVKAKFGITDAFAAIARTGSVCVLNDETMSGSYSLFVNTHIALVNSKDVVENPRDIFQKEPYKNITSNKDFIFISGSSATADMGPLVRGVHGPAKLYVIIIE